MKKKLLVLLMGLLLITGCKESPKEVKEEPKNVTHPVIATEAKKVVTEEVDRSKEDTPVRSYFLEYIFEDNICTKAIYHTKYKVISNTEYNKEAAEKNGLYDNVYIDDDGYLVYDYLGDELLGQSVRDVVDYIQYQLDINIEVHNE